MKPSPCVRHVRVDLRDDQRRGLHRRLDDVHADAQAHVAVHVRRRHLNERHVDFHHAFAEQIGHVGQKDRRVIGHARVDRVAGIVADEKGVVPEVGLETNVGVGRHAHRPHVKNFGVEQRFRVGLNVIDQQLDQALRLAAGRPDEDARATVDLGKDPLFRNELFRICFFYFLEPVENAYMIHRSYSLLCLRL